MLSSVLHSARAVRANIEIMRAFVEMRRMLGVNAELARKIEALERKYEGRFAVVFEAIRELMAPKAVPARPIGFRSAAERHRSEPRALPPSAPRRRTRARQSD